VFWISIGISSSVLELLFAFVAWEKPWAPSSNTSQPRITLTLTLETERNPEAPFAICYSRGCREQKRERSVPNRSCALLDWQGRPVVVLLHQLHWLARQGAYNKYFIPTMLWNRDFEIVTLKSAPSHTPLIIYQLVTNQFIATILWNQPLQTLLITKYVLLLSLTPDLSLLPRFVSKINPFGSAPGVVSTYTLSNFEVESLRCHKLLTPNGSGPERTKLGLLPFPSLLTPFACSTMLGGTWIRNDNVYYPNSCRVSTVRTSKIRTNNH